MAGMMTSNPYERLRVPGAGPPVQNMGGFAPNQAPISQRPVAAPAIRTGTPGPAPGGFQLGAPPSGLQGLQQTLSGIQPTGGPIVTAGAQQAQQQSQQAQARSKKQVSKLTKQQYGRSGGTQADPGTLEEQIRNALSGMFSGSVSDAYVDRSRNALGAAVEGQRATAANRIDDDLIRRGLFRSGMGPELQQANATSAQGAFATGLADILNRAEDQNIQGRQFATQQGSNLLGMNRSYDQYLQQRIDAARNRGGGGPGTQTIIDPDTGVSYEVSSDVFRYL